MILRFNQVIGFGRCFDAPDGGDNWSAIVRDLPAVVSVEVQTLP